MAKTLGEITSRRAMLHLRSSGNTEHVKQWLETSAATGEIAIEFDGNVASGTSLWTLSSGGTAVQFVNKDVVAEMISQGAVAEVDTVEESVGLLSDGSIVSGDTSAWGEGIHYFNSANTVIQAVKAVDSELYGLSGYVQTMDKAASAVTGKFVRTVAENDGKVSETLGFIENTDITVCAATSSEIASLGSNVKEAWKLVNGNGAQLGSWVKIYKDSSLVNFYLGHVDDVLTDEDETTHESPTSAVTSGTGDAALVYIVQLENGNYKLTAVDVESYLTEAEFKDGLEVVNHEVKVKIDSTSESFLTVSENGVKLSGVQDAINSAVNALDAGISGKSTDNHVEVRIAEADGKLTSVEVIGSDIASKDALDAEIAARKAVDGQTGQTYEANTNANYINNASSLNDADVKLDAILGVHSGESTSDYNVTFTSNDNVAKNISDIKKRLDDFKKKLTLTAVDDNKYIATEVTTADTGTTIGISAITRTISASTSSDSALADSYDVRTFAVSSVANHGEGIVVDTSGTDKVLDFSNFKLDCGTF